jgi:hypothetical protein
MLNNLLYFLREDFYGNLPKKLQVCYLASRLTISIMLQSGHTKDRVSPAFCSVGGKTLPIGLIVEYCQRVGHLPGFSSWRTIHWRGPYTGSVHWESWYQETCTEVKNNTTQYINSPQEHQDYCWLYIETKIVVLWQLLGKNGILCLICKKVQIYHARSLYIVMLNGAAAYVCGGQLCQILSLP